MIRVLLIIIDRNDRFFSFQRLCQKCLGFYQCHGTMGWRPVFSQPEYTAR